MSVTAQSSARPARAGVEKRPRGEGQWALGHREPLNPNERTKKDDDGLNVRARIESIYAHRGFASIDPADLRGRLRWWGLYTQRKPGIDGGRTAVLEPHELDDEYFMLRVRIDGGQLRPGPAAGGGRGLDAVRAGHRRPDRPAERPAALGPHRGRAGDLAAAGGRRTEHGRGVWRHPAGRARQPGRRGQRGRGARPDPGHPVHRGALRRRQGVLQPAAQVQVGDLLAARRPVPGQRHLVPRRGPPGARARLRPVGRRRAVHQPDAGPAARASGCRWTRCPRCGPAWSASSATTGTGGCAPGPAEVPRRRLGRGSGSARCWRGSTCSAS